MLYLKEVFQADVATFDFSSDGLYIRSTNESRKSLSVRTLLSVPPLPIEAEIVVVAEEEVFTDHHNIF